MSVTPWVEKLVSSMTRTAVSIQTPTAEELCSLIDQLPIVEQGRLRAAAEAVHIGFSRTTIEMTDHGIRIVHYRNNQPHRRHTIKLGVPA